MTSPAYVQSTSKARETQILVACDDDAVAHELQSIFRAAGLDSVCTKSMATACYFAKAGQFQVIFTAPSLPDGSWRHLIDVSKHFTPAPSVVIVAHSFDLNEWGESLKRGAFDVLDGLQEMPKAAEVAHRALSHSSLEPMRLSPLVSSCSNMAHAEH